jgi:hypothetical protein
MVKSNIMAELPPVFIHIEDKYLDRHKIIDYIY